MSRVHIDFMIGTPDLAVDGITRDSEAVPVLREGAWQI
jgi:aminopeptidase